METVFAAAFKESKLQKGVKLFPFIFNLKI